MFVSKAFVLCTIQKNLLTSIHNSNCQCNWWCGLTAARMRDELDMLMLDVDAFVAAHPNHNYGLPSILDLPPVVPSTCKGRLHVVHQAKPFTMIVLGRSFSPYACCNAHSSGLRACAAPSDYSTTYMPQHVHLCQTQELMVLAPLCMRGLVNMHHILICVKYLISEMTT